MKIFLCYITKVSVVSYVLETQAVVEKSSSKKQLVEFLNNFKYVESKASQCQYHYIIVSIFLFSKGSLTSFHDLALSLHFNLS